MTTRRLDRPHSETVRNVHLYNHAGHVIGGVFQNGSISKSNFYGMCNKFLIFHAINTQWQIFVLQNDGATGPPLQRGDNSQLPPGKYIVLRPNRRPIDVTYTATESVWRVRAATVRSSMMSSTQKHFRDSVRNRDSRCVVSGFGAIDFAGLDAAHVFPLARSQTWNRNNYGTTWITDSASATRIGHNRIFSPQIGLLIAANIHSLFDNYHFSIDVNDNYKVIFFQEDMTGLNLDGRALSTTATNLANPLRVSDRALMWHFEQAVLKNMRGPAGEQWPAWEHDLGEGDLLEIMEGPEPAQRMELELFGRFAAIKENSDDISSQS